MSAKPLPFNARQEQANAVRRALAKAQSPPVSVPAALAASASDLVFARVPLHAETASRLTVTSTTNALD